MKKVLWIVVVIGLCGFNVPSVRCYKDRDMDRYGGVMQIVNGTACPAGYVAIGGDCNDGNAKINPAAQEVCDAANTDEDCDRLSDDNDTSVSAATKTIWYVDVDSDGEGGMTTLSTCDKPSGYVATTGDCNDRDRSRYSAAYELCSDNIDNDCDGQVDDGSCSECPVCELGDVYDYQCYYIMGQGQIWIDLDGDCEQGVGDGGRDCNEVDATINSSATETPGDGIDSNCDGSDDT